MGRKVKFPRYHPIYSVKGESPRRPYALSLAGINVPLRLTLMGRIGIRLLGLLLTADFQITCAAGFHLFPLSAGQKIILLVRSSHLIISYLIVLL